jgi:hypothetical protein
LTGSASVTHAGGSGVGEQGLVLHPLPERGHADGKGIEAIVGIAPERAGTHRAGQVSVGGAHHPEVGGQRLDRADPAVGAGLQQAQQLRLHRGGQLADLVEVEGAAACRLHEARLAVARARERPFLVAEQLALEERLGEPRAIHRHEGAVGARAGMTDDAKDLDEVGDVAGVSADRHGLNLDVLLAAQRVVQVQHAVGLGALLARLQRGR